MPNVLLGRFLINLSQFSDRKTLSGSQPFEQMHRATNRRRIHDTIASIAAPFGEPVEYEAGDPFSDSADSEDVAGSDEAEDVEDLP